jgi:hypothetical protein
VSAAIREIAKAERINPSYVSRVLRLTLLAPATVEAILDGRASNAPTLAEAMGVFPVEWQNQSRRRSEVTSENDAIRELYHKSSEPTSGPPRHRCLAASRSRYSIRDNSLNSP